MLELFQVESETQTGVLTSGLLELERDPGSTEQLQALMRAAHSLKGAARIVNHEAAVKVAHAMEDCFVAAQNGKVRLRKEEIDVLFQGVDLLTHISKRSEQEMAQGHAEQQGRIQGFLTALESLTAPEARDGDSSNNEMRGSSDQAGAGQTRHVEPGKSATDSHPVISSEVEGADRLLRLRPDNLNRLLGLAGESLVESRWLHPFADSLLRLKRLQSDLMESVNGLRESLDGCGLPERVDDHMNETIGRVMECRQFLSDRLVDLEMYDRRSSNLSHRLYLEVLQCRMRPFGDGVRRFPRMVRDLARTLGKQVRLEIVGEQTQVDRDILEKLEAPLAQLLRNAVDHGCETPEDRRRAEKPEECTIQIEARHGAGMLMVTVSDDGAGIHPENLRETVVQKRLTSRSVVEKLTEAELLDFLLLPGFTLKDTVTEISGRGVGLDVVQNTVKGVRGSVRIFTQPGKGMRFQLNLPMTLSVLRTLLVEIAEEPYAIPLSQISRTLKLPKERIETLEGRHHFTLGDQQVGLLSARQVFERGELDAIADPISVAVLGDRTARYGLVVDRFLGERELVVQALDPRLGKVKNISAGSLMEDGSPVLIVDVEDVIRSIEKLVSAGQLSPLQRSTAAIAAKESKRILAVDDSLTVRELERKLLMSHGYTTDVAVDGMDGWNAVRTGNYDLVITDVDMPRMDGIELATLIKNDARLKSIPVMIVSYKDREEDRMRGLHAGADYYLTKGSFDDETLVRAVVDLIGKAEG
ncbi:MAG: chemotaxis protein CheA [Pedosphaera sp.]|nr:chemotaxis protein CheA [Pedosphaera sp.]